MTSQNQVSTTSHQPINAAQAGQKIAGLLNLGQKEQPAQAEQQDTTPKKPLKKAVSDKAAPKSKPAAEVDPDLSAADGMDEGAEDQQQQDILSEPDADDAEGGQSDEDQASDNADAASDAEDVDADGNDQEELHTVVVNGKKMQVPYSELLEGYQRAKDYTHKTQELAKQRKEVEELREQAKDIPQTQKAYKEAAERFSTNATLVLAALEQRFMPKAPDDALLESDPKAYIRQKEHFQEAQQFRHALLQEIHGYKQKEAETQKEMIKKGRAELYNIYPEMQDAANRQKVREYAHKHGFTDEHIMNEPNPVLFVWADKARKYDELMATRQKVVSDNPKPKVTKQDKSVQNHKAVQQRRRMEPVLQHKTKKTVDSAGRAIESVLNLGGKRS